MIDKDLLDTARKIRLTSYSPYSEFKVGAAVICEDGEIYAGTNIENASYGLTICAERVAIFSAISAGNKKIQLIAISCDQSKKLPPEELMPCGACRQVIQEFANESTKIIVDGVGKFGMSELLPLAFSLNK